ncbi:MAG: lytic transglycosylase domain-containing protein [Deltaproteobacteria bacterium]|nr:lytic transglycosylase domain-containing protein [Deltaproteobacteria bacterium]
MLTDVDQRIQKAASGSPTVVDNRSRRSFESILQRQPTPLAGVLARPVKFVVTLRDYLKHPLPTTRSVAQQTPDPKAILGKWRGFQSLAPEQAAQVETALHEASERFRVPKRLLAAVIQAESAFNPSAISRAGAKGLMQLMDPTARALGVRNSFNIRENILGGAKYLRQLLDVHRQNMPLAVAAYNAGPGAVRNYGGIPPYRETREYVSRVMKYFTAPI